LLRYRRAAWRTRNYNRNYRPRNRAEAPRPGRPSKLTAKYEAARQRPTPMIDMAGSISQHTVSRPVPIHLQRGWGNAKGNARFSGGSRARFVQPAQRLLFTLTAPIQERTPGIEPTKRRAPRETPQNRRAPTTEEPWLGASDRWSHAARKRWQGDGPRPRER